MNKIPILVIMEPGFRKRDYESKYYPLLKKLIDESIFDVDMIASDTPAGRYLLEERKKGVFLIKFANLGNVGLRLIPTYLSYLLLAFLKANRLVSKKHYLILMSLGGHTYTGLVVSLLSRIRNKISIIRVAGLSRRTVRYRYSWGIILEKILYLLEHIAFKTANLIVTNTDLSDYFPSIDKRKIIYVVQGVDTKIFHPRDTKKMEKESIIITTVSRLSPEKNILSLIKAFALLKSKYKNIKLFIVGFGPEEDKLKNLARSLKLNDVVFLGYKPPVKVAEILRDTDIFVIPSLSEGFPSSMLEAMACKVPVIAGPAFKEKKEWYEYVLLADGDEISIANAIEKLIKDAKLRKDLAEKAFLKVVNEYNSELSKDVMSKTILKYLRKYAAENKLRVNVPQLK